MSDNKKNKELGLSPSLTAPKAGTGAGLKSVMKTGQQSVKMPKAKKPADPFGKPSLFFKSEEFGTIKKSSIENLRSFLEKNRAKKRSV